MSATPEPIPTSVRDHLDAPTHLQVAPASSGGALTAMRWSRTGWIGGDVSLVVENGGYDAVVDAAGHVIVSNFQLVFAPIDIPESAIGTAARLDHLRLDLASPPPAGDLTWAGDDAATATTTLDLVLSWGITVDNTSTMLGPQHLPPIPMQLVLGGTGASVDATTTLTAMGLVWGWAGLIEISDLRLVIDASTH